MRYVKIGKREIRLSTIALLTALMLLGTTLAITYMTKTFTNTANVLVSGTIELYSDAGCTSVLPSSKVWGSFGVETKSITIYIKNLGNVAVKVRWGSICTPAWLNGQDNYYRDAGTPSHGIWQLDLIQASVKLFHMDATTPSIISLNAGAVSTVLSLELKCSSTVDIDSISFTVSFVASDV